MCFLGVDLKGGGKKTRSPPGRSATASGTRLDSPRGGRILRLRVRPSCRSPAPLPSTPPPRRQRDVLLPLLLPLPSPAEFRNPPRPGSLRSRQPAPSRAPLWALPPRPRSLSSEKLIPELPGRAGVDGAGGWHWGPALGSCPWPPPTPQQVAHSGRELSLCLPRSRSLAPSRLPGRTPGWYRTAGLLVRCAAGVNGIKEKGKHTNKKK
ncbi:serine/arginine repetitive matrix protein 1-like [Heterocephalus glaber]|uniref:Serine/arginine repetitive matrix protein 1-like n=1 Tax=Heterocephalus glaber TaxID=10181 RepID=A0AAX6TF48_HETGA|nr:serine/arginine repetitive matrix protein 1-like [Heterocephalus glaber]